MIIDLNDIDEDDLDGLAYDPVTHEHTWSTWYPSSNSAEELRHCETCARRDSRYKRSNR